jgi:hypothetical protein
LIFGNLVEQKLPRVAFLGMGAGAHFSGGKKAAGSAGG